MYFSLFLSRRFYHAGGTGAAHRAGRLAVRLATGGVALGLCVMILAVSVVRGYQGEIRARLAGFAADVEVLDRQQMASPEAHPLSADPALLRQIAALPSVGSVRAVAQKVGILKTDDAFHAIALKGVDAGYDTTFLHGQMVAGRIPSFGSDDEANSVVISQQQAQALGIGVGSRVYAYFFADAIKVRRLTVAGIYRTYLQQFDDTFVWASRATVAALNGWSSDACSTLEVRLAATAPASGSHTAAAAVSAAQEAIHPLLAARTDPYGAQLDTMSLQENPRTAATLQWIALLDMNVWIILALMLGVAGFTTISGLLILILERTRTIGVLKALGASNTRLRHTFMLYALRIVVRGMVWGNAAGIGLALVQQHFAPVRLDPESYYVSAVPVTLSAGWLLALNAGTLLLTTLTLVLPSLVVSRIQPARAIRFE